MAISDIAQPFMWGQNGQRLTPDQIEQRNKIAQSLLSDALDISPTAGGWASILTKGLQGAVAGYDMRKADNAVTRNAEESQSASSAILQALSGSGGPSGGGATPPTSTPIASAPVSIPQAPEIRQGLISRGLPEHVADAFVLNFQDESGLNPGINEKNPTVPGSRGGYGLYQLTGPRRVAYERFASQRGIDPSNTDAQLDFLMTELQGPESKAAKAILSAPDTGTAAQAIVNNFLRPAEEHRAARAARYANAGSAGTQVASLDPSIGATPAQDRDVMAASFGGVAPSQPLSEEERAERLSRYEAAKGNISGVGPNAASPVFNPATPQPRVNPVAQALMQTNPSFSPETVAAHDMALGGALAPQGQAPQQVADASGAFPPAPSAAAPAAPTGGINPAVIKALSSPYVDDGTKRIAGLLLNQQLGQQQAAQEMQMRQQDPRYQQQLQLGQIELERARNPGMDGVAVGNRIVDRQTGKVIYEAPAAPEAPKAPAVVELFDEATGQPYKATWNPESRQYDRVGGIKARTGMQLTTNPDGTVSLTEGSIGNMPKLTEAEGRNSGFYGRGVESHEILNTLENQGTSLWNKAAGAVPLVGNFLRTEDAQKYDQAKRNFINAVLRRESGAVIASEEFANADQQYFPQPGDGPEVIEQKRKNRETTIQGLKISSGQGAPFATRPESAPPAEKKRLRFNPATGELE